MTDDKGGVDLANITFYEIAKVSEVQPGQRIFVEIDTAKIVILNVAGVYFAIGDVCTHDNGPLGDGLLEGNEIVCPRHGAHFDVRSGKAIRLPAVRATPTYSLRVVNDIIEIGFPNS